MVLVTPPPLSSQSMADLMSTILVLCRGHHEDGSSFWAYLCVKPSMARAFREACDAGGFDLEDFGTIIEWGEGENPPAEMREHMERDYGFNHEYEAQLISAAQLPAEAN